MKCLLFLLAQPIAGSGLQWASWHDVLALHCPPPEGLASQQATVNISCLVPQDPSHVRHLLRMHEVGSAIPKKRSALPVKRSALPVKRSALLEKP